MVFRLSNQHLLSFKQQSCLTLQSAGIRADVAAGGWLALITTKHATEIARACLIAKDSC
jgi:hypothetical protein